MALVSEAPPLSLRSRAPFAQAKGAFALRSRVPSDSDGVYRGGIDTVDPLAGLNFGLGWLPLMTGARTRSVSAENPTGAKGMGGMAVQDPGGDGWSVSSPARKLGRGWKVRPYVWLRSGESTMLMDVDGPGVIQHICLDDNPKLLEWELSRVRVAVGKTRGVG